MIADRLVFQLLGRLFFFCRRRCEEALLRAWCIKEEETDCAGVVILDEK
jgi:hypothetical protein